MDPILRSHNATILPVTKTIFVYTVQDESGMYVRVTNDSDSKHALVDVSDTCI